MKYTKDWIIKGFDNISLKPLEIGVDSRRGFIKDSEIISFIDGVEIEFMHTGKYKLKSGIIITTEKGIITTVSKTNLSTLGRIFNKINP